MNSIEEVFELFDFDQSLFYDAIVNSTDDYIYIGDLKSNAYLITENMGRDFGFQGRVIHDLVNIWGNLIHDKDKEKYYHSIKIMLDGSTCEHNVEYQILNNKNEYIWVHCRGTLKRDEYGVPILFAGVISNLGQKGKVDFTTGLFTQTECEKEINYIYSMPGSLLGGGIMLLGLDNFNRINNLNNHILGDDILRKFAQSIQLILPKEASMYRFDGDQFAIVYRDASREDMDSLYQQIHTYANRQHVASEVHYFCTVSAGIAMFSQGNNNYLDLIKCASSALDSAKSQGKNMFVYFESKMLRKKMRYLEIAQQLQESVRNEFREFHLVYQPLADGESLIVYGAEALLRFQSPTLGMVSPVEFIPILEESELIIPVGKWVFEQAVRTCEQWTSSHPDFVMNVNISYLQMMDTGFCSFIQETINKYSLDFKHIVLELTESHFVTDMVALKSTFEKLHNMPIKIAMDDFGTGYSSLGLLAQSPADVVKIDRIFVKALGETLFNRSFVGAVVQLCHSVNIKVCVEGVEDLTELAIVQELQADTIQGFYISKPIEEKDFYIKYLEHLPR